MSARTILPRPQHRMKTVVKTADGCMMGCDRAKCAYGRYGSSCEKLLILDMLYYLRQTLEKSERKVRSEER